MRASIMTLLIVRPDSGAATRLDRIVTQKKYPNHHAPTNANIIGGLSWGDGV